MKVERRRFLSFLGAAPLAAKAAADGMAGKLIGLSDVPMFGPPLSGISIPPSASGGSTESWKAKVLKFVAQGKIPEWLEGDIRKRNHQVTYIDPDIACKKSWSLSVKIATQRQRNIDKALTDVFAQPVRQMRAQEFGEQFGMWI